jgi:hypothetical protein
MVQEKTKTDWLVPTALILGTTGIGFGLYFYFKKPPGLSPGEQFTAHFKFNYLGESDNFVIQVRLGSHNRVGGADWFIAKPGLYWPLDISLPSPDTYEFDIECPIPDGAPAATYDAEAAIRTPGMSPDDRIVRVFKDDAITIRG